MKILILIFCFISFGAAQYTTFNKFKSYLPTIDPTLIGWWKLDETSGLIASDEVGSAGDLSQTWNFDANDGWVSGKVNNALHFYSSALSSTGHVAIGDIGLFPDNGTLMFWFNSDNMVNYKNILQTSFANIAGNNVGIRFEQRTGGTLLCIFGDDLSVYDTGTLATGTLVAGTWYHVSVTWDKALSKNYYYLDGVKVQTRTNTHFPTRIDNFVFGKGYNYSRDFDGILDEVKVYNRTLTDSDILNYYNSTK